MRFGSRQPTDSAQARQSGETAFSISRVFVAAVRRAARFGRGCAELAADAEGDAELPVPLGEEREQLTSAKAARTRRKLRCDRSVIRPVILFLEKSSRQFDPSGRPPSCVPASGQGFGGSERQLEHWP